MKHSLIRNFGIIAHIDAGKTTTTEKILYLSGASKYAGRVEEGTTVTDWMYEEKERGITIKSAAVKFSWRNHICHLIDTPGHIDFSSEVHRSLRVLDGAIVVLCGLSGVQAQTEKVCREADIFALPLIMYINKLDREGAHYDRVFSEIQDKLGYTPVPFLIPYYTNDSFAGIIDIVHEQYYAGENPACLNVPEEMREVVAIYQELLIDTLTQHDEMLLQKILREEAKPEDLMNALREQTIKRVVTPVLCGSSARNVGISQLCDGIINLFPSPEERYHHTGLTETDGSPVVYLFKSLYIDEEIGTIYYARVYRGTILQGVTLHNPLTHMEFLITSLYEPFALRFEKKESASSGEIVILRGEGEAASGHTLCTAEEDVILEKLRFPEPVMYMRIEPQTGDERELFISIKDRLLMDDPTMTYKEDPVTGETLIGGIGELQIEIFVERIKNQYGITLLTGEPRIAHRITPVKEISGAYVSEIRYGGEIVSVSYTALIEPLPETSHNWCKVNNDHYSSLLEELIEDLMAGGAGREYPFTGTGISISGIDTHARKLPEEVVAAAIERGVAELLQNTAVIEREPSMRLEINVPPEYTGSTVGDLQSRKGTITDISRYGSYDCITATVPLKHLFGYATDLRSFTAGRGSFSMFFWEYA